MGSQPDCSLVDGIKNYKFLCTLQMYYTYDLEKMDGGSSIKEKSNLHWVPYWCQIKTQIAYISYRVKEKNQKVNLENNESVYQRD